MFPETICLQGLLLFGPLGIWELILILLIVLLLFGVKKLPEIGSGLGKGIKNFRNSVRDEKKELDSPKQNEEKTG